MVLKTSGLSLAENKGGKDMGSLCLPTEKETQRSTFPRRGLQIPVGN